jgi:hypothetical protein
MTTYTGPAGKRTFYFGMSAPIASGEPAWAGSLLTTNNAWTSLPGTNFQTWAAANMPAGAYIGTNPIGAIVDAYCDPATGVIGGVPYQFFYGGGHGDGSNNAVVRMNWETLTYSMAALPTPPDKYPRDYGVDRLLPGNSPPGSPTQPGPLRYANGATPGYFDPNPVHGAYSAPALARPSSHMYDTAVLVNGKIHYHYANDAVFNTATGLWETVNSANFGAQLNAISTSLANSGFNTQSSFKYDAATGKIWGTLVPGDGPGSRYHMVRIDAATRIIEAVIGVGTQMIGNGSTLVQVGRWLYSFKAEQTAYDQPATFNAGFRILLDSPYTVEAIACTGVLAPAIAVGVGTEVLPSTYDAVTNRIVRCNYYSASNVIYEINPTPVSGAGTFGDPRLLTQTSRTLSNSLGSPGQYPYSRAFFYPNTRVLCFLPRANSTAYAVRLT